MPVTINDFITDINHWGFCGFISVLQKLRERPAPRAVPLDRFAELVTQFDKHLLYVEKFRERYGNRQPSKPQEERMAWIVFDLALYFIEALASENLPGNVAEARRLAEETVLFTNAFFEQMAEEALQARLPSDDAAIALAARHMARPRPNLQEFRQAFVQTFVAFYQNDIRRAGKPGDRVTIHFESELPFGFALSHNAMRLLLQLVGLPPAAEQVFIGENIVAYAGQRDCILGLQFETRAPVPGFPNHPRHWVYVNPDGHVSDHGSTRIPDHLDIFLAWPGLITDPNGHAGKLIPDIWSGRRVTSIFQF